MRLFIAVQMDTKRAFFDLIRKYIDSGFAKLRFPADNHLTLKFLGKKERHEPIADALRKIRRGHFEIVLDHIGVFPDRRHARVVWVGLEESKSINELHEAIDSALLPYSQPDKDFHAHVTLARVNSITDNESFLKKISGIKVERTKVRVEGFSLIKSTLMPDSVTYETLKTFRLQ